MKKSSFRSVDFWKSAVLTMPDSSFFELMRSVFGKIKTPFNKQQLLRDLEIFLLREDIQRTIASYIDENDAKIIAAVALYGEPFPGELESFFSGEFSYVKLHDIIVNLEERFILYRLKEKNAGHLNESRLALNPVLEQVLLPFISDFSVLFPVIAKTDNVSPSQNGSREILNERTLAAFLSFVSQWESPPLAKKSRRLPPFFKSEGVISKQVIEAGKTVFPGIDLEEVLGSLQVMGLFYADADRLLPDRKRFSAFENISCRERMEYCAAALLVYKVINSPAPDQKQGKRFVVEILPPLYKSRIRETANFIHSFLDSLNTEYFYTERTLKRLAEILKAKTSVSINIGIIFEVMEKTGLIIEATIQTRSSQHSIQENPCTKIFQPGSIVMNMAVRQEAPSVTIDAGFTVLVYPGISYADAISLAAFLNIKEAGAVVRFEMEKDSVVRAFDNNISAGEIIDLLKRLSGSRVDDTFIWNLQEWEKRHKEVSLKKGVVLTLAQDKRYLTQTMPLASLIIETLAEGVYLLDENAMHEAASALQNAGIDIIAGKNTYGKTRDLSQNYFPSPVSYKLDINTGRTDYSEKFTSHPDSRTLTEEFHAKLKKMKIGKIEHDELSARINRHLVLCEAQLNEADIRYEKIEARHLDYAGKLNVAKQAIAQHLPVEIIMPEPPADKQAAKGNFRQNFYGTPKAIEKDNDELILIVVPAENEEAIRVPLAKISLLRRIKKSIFET